MLKDVVEPTKMLSNTTVEYFITALRRGKESNSSRTLVFSTVQSERILNGMQFANEIDDGVNIFDLDNIIITDLAGVHFSIYLISLAGVRCIKRLCTRGRGV